MHIAIVTAGGAGMFCGSCMLDNTLARAIRDQGHEVTLIPTYTPIRTDEENASESRIFFGGINVYLDSKIGLWNRLPQRLVRWLNHPRLIEFATRFSVSNDARDLGRLTVQMLDGPAGPQRREVDELVRFLADELAPDAILFSNALLSGVMPALRPRYDGLILCLLQGDDIFLDALVEPWASRARQRIRSHARLFDGMIVHSEYYRDRMSASMEVAAERFSIVPPGIDLTGHDGRPGECGDTFVVGYLARVCPEKGFDQVIEGFRAFHRQHPNSKLKAAGYLGPRDEAFFRRVMSAAEDLGDAVEFCGSPATRAEKIAFLRSVAVLSVPTSYQEPKGLYVLEALANGVPVVQPAHGAFPELIARTGGGLLFRPGSAVELAERLSELMTRPALRMQLATAGHAAVHSHCSAARMAADTLTAVSSAAQTPADSAASL